MQYAHATRLADKFNDDGILFPIRVMSEEQAGAALNWFQTFEEREGGMITGSTANNLKPHLLYRWLSDLVCSPKVLDAVENILGPDILCWTSHFFSKKPGDGQIIPWHQDSAYFELSSTAVLTAWIAFTPSIRENGCLQVVPGSHWRNAPHQEAQIDGNMLSRGQELAVDIQDEEKVEVCLDAGEMSLHNVRIFHGSDTNSSDMRRVGFAVRYIPTDIRQLRDRTSAMLVRGVDKYHNFDVEQPPEGDLHPDAIAMHAHAAQLINTIRYRSSAA